VGACKIIKIDSKGFLALIKSMDVRKSGGPDGISGYLLKSFEANVTNFVRYITRMFEISLQKGEIPSVWKEAYICPIYKGGNRSSPSNYRPVSLTCILSKTLEHVVCSSMWKHIEENNLLSNYQHGFRKSLNTTTQLLHVTYKASEALDNKLPYHIVSFDFSKAFDMVPHKFLLYKLTKYKFS
jgi:hypothetical protein